MKKQNRLYGARVKIKDHNQQTQQKHMHMQQAKILYVKKKKLNVTI